jgi:hypothetical protein
MFPACFRWCAWLLAVPLLAAGCGKGSGATPLSGTVKLDGRPLANATVQFIAQNPGGRDALGCTDAKGVFCLSTLKTGDGAFPGRYKVVVQPVTPADAGVATAPPWAKTRPAAAEVQKPKCPAITIPPRYSEPGQTVLVQDVPASREVVFELENK